MACKTYNTDELLALALKVIEEEQPLFIDEIVSFMPCSRSTFYEYGLDKSDELKQALQASKDKQKSKLRKKWYDGDNATTDIALYKLLANKEERDALNNNIVNNTTFNVEALPKGVELEIEDD